MNEIDQIKAKINMLTLCEVYGLKLDSKGRCACPIHGGTNKESFRVVPNKTGYVCASCDAKGDIVQFIEAMDECDFKTAVAKLKTMAGVSDEPPKKVEFMKKPVNKWEYTDKGGNTIFEVHRFETKDGKQKKVMPFCNGKYGITDDIRCLYNLDLLTTADMDRPVFIVEGEKTADAVSSLGFLATCNPMGSKQWSSQYGYAETLRDRKVVIIPDADEGGKTWLKDIIADVRGKVASVQVIDMPEEYVKAHPELRGHDLADMCMTDGAESATAFLYRGMQEASVMVRGVEEGLIVTPQDAFNELVELHRAGDFEILDLSNWIPVLDIKAHYGDLVVIMANTGVGKTRIMHNIPYFIRNVRYDLFDLELSRAVLGLRYASMHTRKHTKQILKEIKAGYDLPKIPLDHIFLNNGGNIDMQHVSDRVHMHEDIIQEKIQVVGIDYIGLMKKQGRSSRYQDLSAHIEEFKGFLTAEGRVGLATTQVSRPPDKIEGYFMPPSAFDAKDSGSVENSAQELLGVWRLDPDDKSRLGIQTLKYTHGDYNSDQVEITADGLVVGDKLLVNNLDEKSGLPTSLF